MTIKHLLILSVLTTTCLAQLFRPVPTVVKRLLGYPEDNSLTFEQITKKYGYPSEEHDVTTQDGYILKMFRIIDGKNCTGKKKKTPLLLMHGLFQSSESWIDSGPEAGLAYLLADECYDLWLGNVRGNYHSRRHIRYNADFDRRFWEFSRDEMGYYDLPAMIDYVLDHTDSKQLNYVGFSQGGASFFIMCSERPGYCNKAKAMVALAPAAKLQHTKSVVTRIYCEAVEDTINLLNLLHVYELMALGTGTQNFMEYFCQLRADTERLCRYMKGVIDSYHPGSITLTTVSRMYAHFPAGTSTKNIQGYSQHFRTDGFKKFDYGRNENLRVYDTDFPPSFNLTAVNVPVLIIYGQNDNIVDTQDVEWLSKELPNLLESHLVDDPLWNHYDVTYGKDTNIRLMPKIREYLNKLNAD